MEMGLSSKNLAWVFILLSAWVCGCKGCIKEEKMGLLEIKAFMKSSAGENAVALLPSWTYNNTSECCSWERVVCHPTTHRVTKLFLSDVRQTYEGLENYENLFIYGNGKSLLLNASIFLPFEELHHLNLSLNSLDGFIGNEGFNAFSHLKELEVLDICGNAFDKSVLRSLGMVTSLKTLGLCAMGWNGSFPIQELGDLKSLEVLDLSYNELKSFPLVQELACMRNLKVLDLRSNQLESFQLVQDSNISFIFGNLETLNLDANNFNSASIQQLNVFTTLSRLSLNENGLEGFFPIQALRSLEKLTMLDLSYNGFIGFEDANSSFILGQLESLNLDDNHFNNTSIQQLNKFTSLKRLSLRFNELRGFFPVQDLHSLKKLVMLDLSSNHLMGTFEVFTSLTNLEVLDLSDNVMSGIIPSSIRLMSSLKSLSLADNNFIGYSLPNQDLCQLNKLEQLDLKSNSLQGILPPCLNNLTSLRLLDLSHNSLSGNLTCSLLAKSTSLEYIDLSNNLFEGSFSFNCLANHSKLQMIKLGSRSNKFSVEAEDSIGWVPLFQLKFLFLSNCRLMGSFPNFLRYQFELMVVDLSHNKLTGRFPNWMVENNTRLEYLRLRNNSLIGEMLLHTPNLRIRYLLDISDNQIEGELQENLADIIPNVLILNLSNNGFQGVLPSSVADLKQLRELDLSANDFSGEVPRKLLAVDHLEVLLLSNNKFEGEIFSTDFKLTSIEKLHLDNNRFVGNLSNIITKGIKYLVVLDVSHNNMSGEIPNGIGNMTYLEILLLAYNSFKGKLPNEIAKLRKLKFVDVSHNTLFGHLPCLNGMDKLKHLHFQVNMFEGWIPNDFLNSSSLLTLDIRGNKLNGSIPSSIFALLELRILLLGGNHLSGSIPDQLCHLRNISLMDLSNNNFSGSIPKCFSIIRFGNMRIKNVFEPELHLTELEAYTFESGNVEESIGLSMNEENVEDDEIQFVTKYRFESYGGGILDLMYGLDLSCNNLIGEIPHELGMLKGIHTLNLSHNQLKGSIPKSFSNLSQIESLDLSYNQLSGQIPPELVELNFLSVFNVAHNNISGPILDKAQFSTFNESSYEDNPFLCGQLLDRKCGTNVKQPTKSYRESEENRYDTHDVTFFASFATSYIIVLLAFATVLYINPYWRKRWFSFIEECIYSCYYFACDT